MPFSFGMATIDVFVIASIAFFGFKWGLVIAMGLGGGLGAMTAMYVHERWVHEQGAGNRPDKGTRNGVL